MAEDRQACLDAGMDRYLTKPVDSTALFEVIAETAGTCPVAVDEVAVLDGFGGDSELVARLVPVFLRESSRLLLDLDDAIRAGDAAAIERLAHRLKGSIGQWSTASAYEAARAIESAARSAALEGVAEPWGILRAELPAVQIGVSRLGDGAAA